MRRPCCILSVPDNAWGRQAAATAPDSMATARLVAPCNLPARNPQGRNQIILDRLALGGDNRRQESIECGMRSLKRPCFPIVILCPANERTLLAHDSTTNRCASDSSIAYHQWPGCWRRREYASQPCSRAKC